MTSHHTRTKTQKRRNPFTLIELLIVLVILGILSLIIIQNFGNFSENAKETVDQANLATLQRHLQNFRAANGHFPGGLHSGLNDAGTASIKKVTVTGKDAYGYDITAETTESFLPPVIEENMDKRTREVDNALFPYVCKALIDGGVYSVLYGYNDYSGRPLSKPDELLGFRSIDTSWVDPSGNTFNWSGYPMNYQTWEIGDGVSGHNYYIPFFISNRTDWKTAYDKAGNDIGSSKIMLDEPPKAPAPGDAKKTYYYILVFRVYVTSTGDYHAAELCGVYSPNNAKLGTGKKLTSDGNSF